MSLISIAAVSWWMIIPLAIIGSVLHFVYEWSGRNRVAAIFSAVNESYWEHIKIAVWPIALLHAILFAAGGYAVPSFLPASAIALFSLPITMVALAFVYKSVTKRNVLWLDIALFVIMIALAQTLFVLVLEQLDASAVTVTLSAGYLVCLLVAFFRFTLRPPREPDLFIDPITGTYGVPEDREV